VLKREGDKDSSEKRLVLSVCSDNPRHGECVCARVCVCLRVFVCVCMCVHELSVYVYVYLCAYVCVCMSSRAHAYAFARIFLGRAAHTFVSFPLSYHFSNSLTRLLSLTFPSVLSELTRHTCP